MLIRITVTEVCISPRVVRHVAIELVTGGKDVTVIMCTEHHYEEAEV